MGAAIFYDYEDDPGGMNLKAAFRRARDDTAWEHGHGGYTGTIAEKHDVVVISSLAHAYDAAVRKADALIRAGDRRIDDKWGPAGAIRVDEPGDDESPRYDGWLFFGWSSC